jgi:hypothetical protein
LKNLSKTVVTADRDHFIIDVKTISFKSIIRPMVTINPFVWLIVRIVIVVVMQVVSVATVPAASLVLLVLLSSGRGLVRREGYGEYHGRRVKYQRSKVRNHTAQG